MLIRREDKMRRMEMIIKEIDANLMEASKSAFVFSRKRPDETKGLIIGLHEFSAGPWQFQHLAVDLSERGYHVYVLRFPGHGYQKDGHPTEFRIVNDRKDQRYQTFVDTHLNQVVNQYKEACPDKKVRVIGMSFGGALGYVLALNKHIDRVVLIDPFFAPPGIPYYLAKFINSIAYISDGLSDGIARLIPSPFLTEERKRKQWNRAGHYAFTFNNIMPLYVFGLAALSHDYSNVRANIQLTKTNYESNVSHVKLMIIAAKKNKNTCLHIFDKDSKVMHSPFHYKENKYVRARAMVRGLIMGVIEDRELYGCEGEG